MKILFRFGDNDFYTTFTKVFELLLERIEADLANYETYGRRYNLPAPIFSKQYVCDFINTLAYPIYKTMQNHKVGSLESQDPERFATPQEEEKFYREYFYASPDKIYLDDEVDALLRDFGGQCNGDWFVLDTKQHKYKNWVV